MAKNTGPVREYTRRIIRVVHGIVEVFFHWIFGLVYGGAKHTMPPIKDLVLLEPATVIAMKIRTGKRTSVQVLESFIDRIKEVNPSLNCVVANRFAQARKEAIEADAMIKSGEFSQEILAKVKPLYGVPFTTKDCIAVKGLIHSSGLYCRKETKSPKNALSIQRLINAGAIPIALTNVSELCMWWESSNKVHGRTNNPYDTSRIVGGSSGGEGCGQAAAVSAFGIGSDIGGSIRMPAFFNGVFGHKPSPDVVPNDGQYPEPVSDEQRKFLGIGPICRRAEDLLPIFKIISGNPSRLRLDEPVDLKSIKFYYQESDGGARFVSAVSPDIKELFVKISKHLEKAHNIKATRVSFKRFKISAAMWLANMKAADSPTFAEQLANLKGSINPWRELIKSVFRRSDHTLIAILTCLIENGGCKYGDEKYQHLVNERDAFRTELLDLLGDDGVLLYPTHPTSAPYHNEPLIKPFNFSYTGIVNVLKLPATHCPMGLDRHGLPIGVQVIAADGNDRLCLAVAMELEKAFGGWVPPSIQA